MDEKLTTALWSILIGLFIYWFYKKLREPFDTIKSWNCPYIPCWPIIGNFTRNNGTADIQCIKQFKKQKIVGLQALRFPYLLVVDHELIKNIMVKDFHIFPDRLFLAINPKPLNRSIISLTHQHWKHVRGLVTPTFTTGKLKCMHPLLDRAAENALDYLAKRENGDEPILIKEFFTCFTMDAVASSLFGLEVDSHRNKNHPFVKHALDSMNTTITNPTIVAAFLFPELVKIITKFGSFLVRLGAMEYFHKIVAQTLKERKESPQIEYHDFLQNLACNEIPESECNRTSVHEQLGHVWLWSEKGLTRDEIFAQAVTFMAAGFETTATTLQMLAYNLAMHPDVQEKVFDEIQRELGDNDLTYDDLNNFPYLEMCIHETLRLHPPASRTQRVCTKTVQYGDIIIKKGVSVMIPLYGLGMDPDVFEEPKRFDPERFSAEAKMKRKPHYYIPFGQGPRNCVGMRLAWQEMKILAVKLLQKYIMEPCSETKSPDELDFGYQSLMYIKTPIKLKIIPR